MSLDEYFIRMRSAQLKYVDELEVSFQNAWAKRVLDDSKNNKYTVKTKRELFDYEKAIASITGEVSSEPDSVKEELLERRRRYYEAKKILEERRKLGG